MRVQSVCTRLYTINLPALRHRDTDIDLLAQHFLRTFASELECDAHSLSPDVLTIFHRYTWPGNVREFESVIRQALLNSTGPVLLPDFLPANVKRQRPESSEVSLEQLIAHVISEEPENVHNTMIEHVERKLFQTMMQRTDGNLSQAARILGITRVTLRNKLRDLGTPPSDTD